jgi:hypothetical protein
LKYVDENERHNSIDLNVPVDEAVEMVELVPVSPSAELLVVSDTEPALSSAPVDVLLDTESVALAAAELSTANKTLYIRFAYLT